jgi:hypothetical protein
MANTTAETLEGLISTYINNQYPEVPPTEEEFNNAAELVRNSSKMMNITVTDEEFESIKKHLKSSTVMILDNGIMLPDLKNGHKPWVASRRAEIDPFYWERYKKYLEQVKHWNPRVTAKLGQVSDEILDQCGDPNEKSFHIRGLILGDVQSGKTANYTAIANKAADAGYKLIIVLAGIPEVLRQQTQKRLDAEFCGRRSNSFLDPKTSISIKNKAVGVGRFGTKKKVASFTSEANDFNRDVLKSNDLSLDNVNCPVLLVVKKNKTILNNLADWIKYNNLINGTGQIELPMLLLDDEADNASVNTHDEDTDPTAINNAIRNILSLFTKTTYVAVTATPFANIFINPANQNDLFPSDFIYALSSPSAYIGADRIFGDDADKSDMLERINVDEFLKVFPDKHKKTLHVEELPEDMYEAVYYFLLTNAVRWYRGDGNEHSSMMIHVSRFINVQNQIAEILNAWLDQVKSDVHNYAKLALSTSEKITNIHNLHEVWDKYDLGSVSGLKWSEVLKKYLYKAIAPIDVRAVNGKASASKLDYDQHKEDGLKIIAVGGNTLSRGLTLEGLVVTYFYRTTNMYDTLMQMGRWFGYRPNYDDLVKIWLSQDEIDWYGQITIATDDLREQIAKMKEAHQTPSNFGLRVMNDPGYLIVTARNKMRTATTINCPVTVAGHLLETPRLPAIEKDLSSNMELIKKFISRLASEGERVSFEDDRTRGNYFWEGVSGRLVSELLLNFKTHLWHLNYNGKGLSDYVLKEYAGNVWDVVLMNKGDGPSYPMQISCGTEELSIDQTESRKVSMRNGALNIMGTKLRVGAGGCAQIGLTKEDANEIRKNVKKGKTRKNASDTDFLIKDRPPILMLHILDAVYENEEEQSKYPEFLAAIGVGFPDDETGTKTASYQVNLVDLENWLGTDEDDEGEDVD